MGTKREDDEKEMIENLKYNLLEQYIETHGKDPTHQFICEFCGSELNPRRFEFDDAIMWGIFDNCRPFKEQKVYPTLKEAIEAFQWQK